MALPSRAAFSVLCLVLVPAFLVLAEQPPRTPRPISIDDYFQIRVVSDPDLSPEGGFVTYTVESRLLKEDKNEDRIWMVPTAGGEAVPLTAAGNPNYPGLPFSLLFCPQGSAYCHFRQAAIAPTRSRSTWR